MKAKNTGFMKEIIIFILLLILIMLILAVALYDFIPANISISKPIEYSADNVTTSIKQEIAYTNGGDVTADETSDEALVTSLKSYSIEASDLNIYSEKNLFNRGNSNPFDYAQEETVETTTEEKTNTENNTGTEDSNKTQTTTTSTSGQKTESNAGTFFESSSSK